MCLPVWYWYWLSGNIQGNDLLLSFTSFHCSSLIPNWDIHGGSPPITFMKQTSNQSDQS